MIEEAIPNQKMVEKMQAGVDLLVSLLMVVSGIGLLQMKPWGRTVSIAYAYYKYYGSHRQHLLHCHLCMPETMPLPKTGDKNRQ